jgi:aspartyl protease family protein
MMRSVLVFAALALAAAATVPRYLGRAPTDRPAPVMVAAQPVAPPSPAASNSRSVVVRRNAEGHFQIDGRVNGRRLTFLVDTGASVIALSADAAATLGIHPAEHEFTTQVRTANGTVNAAPIVLDTVEIDDLELHNIAALVLPDGALTDNLLGMSFLSRLRHWEFANGELVLEQ